MAGPSGVSSWRVTDVESHRGRAVGDGRARRASSRCGDDSITLVKLTISEASVRAAHRRKSEQPATKTRAGHQGGSDQGPRTVGTCVAEHAPTRQVIGQGHHRGTRCGGGCGGRERVPGRPAANGTTSSRTTLSALPGRRSKRLTTLAEPAITAPPTSVANGPISLPVLAGDRSSNPRGRQTRDPQTHDLDEPGRHLASSGGGEVAAQAPRWSCRRTSHRGHRRHRRPDLPPSQVHRHLRTGLRLPHRRHTRGLRAR